ncbi:MAG: M48 family metalloprotease [Candidatus Omnitrophota bacterium]|nr:M48 family metalloprotease [Candidatus Omnitrophota bacterium]
MAEIKLIREKIMRIIFILIILCCIPASVSYPVTAAEREFGCFIDRRVVSSSIIIFDEELTKRVNQIGNRIARVSDKPDIDYKFRIISSPVINASTCGAGFVYVYTGLLDILESEEELAAVLAHEIGHSCKSHPLKFYRSSKKKERVWQGVVMHAAEIFGEVAAQFAGASKPSPYSFGWQRQSYADQVYLASYGVGMATAMVTSPMLIGWINGYGRQNECEADDLAVVYLKKAGYDPRAFLKFLRRLQLVRDRLDLSRKGYSSSLINAEPGLEERIKMVEAAVEGGM